MRYIQDLLQKKLEEKEFWTVDTNFLEELGFLTAQLWDAREGYTSETLIDKGY